jgi:hypothetical protein
LASRGRYTQENIEDTVALCSRQSEVGIALCPLSKVNFLSEEVELTPDIRLRRWSRRDICLFRFRDSQEFLWDDFKVPGVINSVAEMSFSVPERRGQIIRGISSQESQHIITNVQDSLDLLKWALFVAADSMQPVAEGTCLIKGRLDFRIARFQRDQNLHSLLSLNGAAIDRCKRLITDFRAVSDQWQKDIQQALWHFGRSCVATLPRDILLEAAIKLDGLMVPRSGDSQYRFCLHGAVILSSKNHNSTELFARLKKIYSERSHAAHGGPTKKVEDLAADCRKKLAIAIERIVELIRNNELPPADDLAQSVQRYVIEQATKSVFPFPPSFAR